MWKCLVEKKKKMLEYVHFAFLSPLVTSKVECIYKTKYFECFMLSGSLCKNFVHAKSDTKN